MKLMIQNGDSVKPLENMNGMQTRQAGLIMEKVASLIPHEGVDYDMEFVFSSSDPFAINVTIKAYTPKGEFWRDYVSKMMKSGQSNPGNKEKK